MTKILILGAHGQIARVATDLFLSETDAQLTLYLRRAKRLKVPDSGKRVCVVEGDEIAYGTTQKGEPFKNPSATVSRKSVASLVVKLATTSGLEIRHSLGVHKES